MQRIRAVKRWEYSVMAISLTLPVLLTAYSILIGQLVLALALGFTSLANFDLFHNANKRPKEIPYVIRPYLMLEAAYHKRSFDPRLKEGE